MRNIEELIAASSHRDISGLLAVDPGDLAQYVADTSNDWWKRRKCALALVGRVPEQYVSDLIARVCDLGETGEVREALLEALSDRAELLPWLRYEAGLVPSYAKGPILQARGRLGDLSAVPELAVLAASPWDREGTAGQAGLDALVERYGLDAILADVGAQSPEARMCQVRLRATDGQDVTYALADPDRAVASTAQSLTKDVDRLRAYLDHDEAPTVEAKLWAAYRLHQLTQSEAEIRAVYEALGRPRVEVPGLDEDMRRAIVHEYAAHCQRQSDPRWRIEAICTEPPPVDEGAQLDRAIEALTAAGLKPLPPVTAGEYHRQGAGSYHVVFVGGGEGGDGDGDCRLAISTLGWYAQEFSEEDWLYPIARRALEAAGFRWIGEDVAGIRVTDLCVYSFGRRDELTVGELLFYWQD